MQEACCLSLYFSIVIGRKGQVELSEVNLLFFLDVYEDFHHTGEVKHGLLAYLGLFVLEQLLVSLYDFAFVVLDQV
jgi:hypothetical protein